MSQQDLNCPSDMYPREGYWRTDESGKESYVRPTCVHYPGTAPPKQEKYTQYPGPMPKYVPTPKARKLNNLEKLEDLEGPEGSEGSEGPVRPTDGQCPPGTILRKGYTRNPYTRQDGTYVNSSYVAPSCIPARGARALGLPQGPKIPAKKGELSQFGYTTKVPPTERYKALDQAAKELGWLPAFRHLNVRATQLKRTVPRASVVMQSDMNYLKLLGELSPYFWDDPQEERDMALQDLFEIKGYDTTVALLQQLQKYWAGYGEAEDTISDDLAYLNTLE